MLAGMGASTVALVENGWRPKRGLSLVRLEEALTEQEEANGGTV